MDIAEFGHLLDIDFDIWMFLTTYLWKIIGTLFKTDYEQEKANIFIITIVSTVRKLAHALVYEIVIDYVG